MNSYILAKQVQVALLVLIFSQAQSFTIHTTTHRSLPSSSPIRVAVAPKVQQQQTHQYYPQSLPTSKSPLFHHSIKKSHLAAAPANNDDNTDDDLTPLPTYGGLIGKLTGLSMTAIRKSFRTTTGLSLTAVRTTLRGLTGVSVNASLKTLFGVFPPWVSYIELSRRKKCMFVK